MEAATPPQHLITRKSHFPHRLPHGQKYYPQIINTQQIPFKAQDCLPLFPRIRWYQHSLQRKKGPLLTATAQRPGGNSAASKMQPSVSESLQGEGQPLSCCDGEAGPVCLVKRKEWSPTESTESQGGEGEGWHKPTEQLFLEFTLYRKVYMPPSFERVGDGLWN